MEDATKTVGKNIVLVVGKGSELNRIVITEEIKKLKDGDLLVESQVEPTKIILCGDFSVRIVKRDKI